MRKFLRIAVAVLLVTAAAVVYEWWRPSPAVAAPPPGLAAGKFLVASRDLGDPNFAETVVLLAQYDKKGAMGLVINRPTRLPMSRVLEGMPTAGKRGDPVFLGGPVTVTGVLALLRSRSKPDRAQPVFQDVYLLNEAASLEKAIGENIPASKFRVYLGYAGWGAGQLEREIDLGAWHIFDADGDLVFDPDPRSVWDRLISRTEDVLVRLLAGTGPTA